VDLLDFLFQSPVLSVKTAQKHLECSCVKANSLIMQFAKPGLLEEVTGWQRNRRFHFKAYLDLFDFAAPLDAQPGRAAEISP